MSLRFLKRRRPALRVVADAFWILDADGNRVDVASTYREAELRQDGLQHLTRQPHTVQPVTVMHA